MNLKKILKSLLELGLVAGSILFFLNIKAFAGYLPIPEEATEVFISEGQIAVPMAGKTGLETLKILAINALFYFKVIVAAIAILYITIMGYRLVTKSGEEDAVTKAKSGIIYAVVALVLISMSQEIAKLFDMEKRTLLESPQEILNRVHLFDKQVEIVITFIKYIIGSFAILMIIRSAIQLIVGGGEEEEAKKHKQNILYSAGGLVLIYIGDIFINKVFYKIDKSVYTGLTGATPGVDPEEGVRQLVGITNFIVSFVGPVAVLMFIVAAIMYATAGGEEERIEKAKRILLSAVIGILIIYGAFAIISTVISGRLGSSVGI